jgi:hypothetical protein
MKDKKINKLKTSLLKLAKEVEEQDRLEVALHVGVSYITITRYLKGEVSKPVTAERIINFLNKKLTQEVA